MPSLPFAVGVYLPLQSSTPIFLGGAVRFVVDRVNTRRGRASATETEAEMSPGTLLSTGYIAGASIAGVICAFVAASPTVSDSLGGLFKVPQDDSIAAVAAGVMVLILLLVGLGLLLKSPPSTGAGPTRGIDEEGMQ